MRTEQEIAESTREYSDKKHEKAVVQFHFRKCVTKETQNNDEMTEEQKEE